jgi:hypothetical protein
VITASTGEIRVPDWKASWLSRNPTGPTMATA